MSLLQNVKLLFGLSQQVDKIKAGPRAGVQSSEFWVTALISLYATISPAVPEPYNIIVPTVATSLYVIARAIVKMAHDLGYAKNIQLPETPTGNLDTVAKD